MIKPHVVVRKYKSTCCVQLCLCNRLSCRFNYLTVQSMEASTVKIVIVVWSKSLKEKQTADHTAPS